MARKTPDSAFRNRICLVTGAASGIGRALATQLGACGAQVIAADIDEAGARQTAEAIAGRATAYGRYLDVADLESWRALMQWIEQKLGCVDVLVNNAAIAVAGEFRDVSLEQARRVLDVDLMGVMAGSKLVYEQMARRGDGHIVNIASIAALLPLPLHTAYGAAKAGVVALSSILRLEGAALGVRVSVVCPGAIETPIFDRTTIVGIEENAARAYFRRGAVGLEPAAREILRQVAANRGIIIVPWPYALAWHAYRIYPAGAEFFLRYYLRTMRKYRCLSPG